MLRVNQIKVVPEAGFDIIKRKAASILGVNTSDFDSFHIVKQSIDARKKPNIYYSYSVDINLKPELSGNEAKILKRCKGNQVSLVTNNKYIFPTSGNRKLNNRPVIIGMGPAGLFCGYLLSRHGYRPIIIERGKDVDSRSKDVEDFWNTGILNPNSNVQFGEGGAGTFSDGKLNTLIKDKDGRNKEVLDILVQNGAPEKILYDAKPHIGTDVLKKVVRNMRQDMLLHGADILFETEMKRLHIKDNRITGIEVSHESQKRSIECETLILAIGHSARNTFETLYEQNIPMEAKAFAVGFRVVHLQSMINEEMYGTAETKILGAAPYKVTAKTSVNRGVYSFCMCPGGYVVNASSEEGRLVVNGMSYSKRDSANANSAIIVSVTPEDFGSDHPLAGITFQRELEEKAFKAGKGTIPVQTYGAFRSKISEHSNGNYFDQDNSELQAKKQLLDSEDEQIKLTPPCIKGAFSYADLTHILPHECNLAFVEGMEVFGHQIKGFNRPETLLLGVESRTSSPVRIIRDETLQSKVKGLYPCGEGAGYAGGITSAAMDGMRIAEEIASKYQCFS